MWKNRLLELFSVRLLVGIFLLGLSALMMLGGIAFNQFQGQAPANWLFAKSGPADGMDAKAAAAMKMKMAQAQKDQGSGNFAAKIIITQGKDGSYAFNVPGLKAPSGGTLVWVNTTGTAQRVINDNDGSSIQIAPNAGVNMPLQTPGEYHLHLDTNPQAQIVIYIGDRGK